MQPKSMYEYEVMIEGRSGSKEHNTFTILTTKFLGEKQVIIVNGEYFVIVEIDNVNGYIIVKSITDSAVKVNKII